MPYTDETLGNLLEIHNYGPNDLILFCTYNAAPPTTASKFEVGALCLDTVNGVLYINVGTTASPSWNNVAAIAASEIALAEGSVLVGNSSGVATAISAKTSGRILVGDGTTIASVAVSGDITISSSGVTAIGAGKVLLAMLGSGITPSHVVKFAGSQANGGGSATIAITVTGAASTDVATAVIRASTNAVTVQKATLTTNTLTLLLSGDPGASTIIDYSVLRAAA